MKKTISLMLVLTLIVALAAGCGKKPTETPATSETVPQYEFTVRELPEAKYITPAEAFAGGDGTEADPYQISSAAELALLNKIVAEDHTSGEKSHYILTADISLNDVSDFDSWATKGPEYSWEPIGFGVGSSGFRGVLDGKGHTIYGIYINTNCEDATSNTLSYGLFAFVSGTVKNLNIDKSYFELSGRDTNLGSIVGYLFNTGSVENCTSSAVLKTYDSICGGIVGNSDGGVSLTSVSKGEKAERYTSITGCTFSGKIEIIKEDTAGLYIGGIVAYNGAHIDSCTNEGELNYSAYNARAAGGIAGIIHTGYIKNCKNTGSLLCKTSGPDDGFTLAGGIAGMVFLTNTGSDENMSRGITVSNCENTGHVEAELHAGGIVGQVYNSLNHYCAEISDCKNSGTLSTPGSAGGIIGEIQCKAEKQSVESVVVKNCENSSDINSYMSGGIIATFVTETGDVTVKNCVNHGNLVSSGSFCGGIIAYWLMDATPADSTIKVDSCKNDGSVSASSKAGGIISYADLPVVLKMGKNLSISISNCENSGDVSVSTINGYIGGILGNFGMKDIPTVVENCKNSGKISITAAADTVTDKDAEVMTLSRIAGGVIGRVGAGLLLTTDHDEGNAKNVQAKNSVLTVRNCSSTGKLVVVNKNAENVKNWFGGVIGNASAEKGYSIFVSDCTYSGGFERGLGNEDYEDIGEKLS